MIFTWFENFNDDFFVRSSVISIIHFGIFTSSDRLVDLEVLIWPKISSVFTNTTKITFSQFLLKTPKMASESKISEF
jgi:hypothetical protein